MSAATGTTDPSTATTRRSRAMRDARSGDRRGILDLARPDWGDHPRAGHMLVTDLANADLAGG